MTIRLQSNYQSGEKASKKSSKLGHYMSALYIDGECEGLGFGITPDTALVDVFSRIRRNIEQALDGDDKSLATVRSCLSP